MRFWNCGKRFFLIWNFENYLFRNPENGLISYQKYKYPFLVLTGNEDGLFQYIEMYLIGEKMVGKSDENFEGLTKFTPDE